MVLLETDTEDIALISCSGCGWKFTPGQSDNEAFVCSDGTREVVKCVWCISNPEQRVMLTQPLTGKITCAECGWFFVFDGNQKIDHGLFSCVDERVVCLWCSSAKRGADALRAVYLVSLISTGLSENEVGREKDAQ